jgi:hypothetical protein
MASGTSWPNAGVVGPVEITGFQSKTEIDQWVNGDRGIAWLRSQGYAK